MSSDTKLKEKQQFSQYTSKTTIKLMLIFTYCGNNIQIIFLLCHSLLLLVLL